MVTITLTAKQLLFFTSLAMLIVAAIGYMVYFLTYIVAQQKKKHARNLVLIGRLENQVTTARAQLKALYMANNQRSNYINSVFATMEDGVVVFNRDFQIQLINPAAREMLSVSNQVMFQHKEQSLTVLMEKTIDLSRLTFGLGETKMDQVEVDHRFFSISTILIFNRYAKQELLGVLAIIKDVTEQHKIELLRKEFVSNVSHEFRTPITLISGFVEMLRTEDNITKDEHKRALEIIEAETERLKRLISELLTLSKIEGSLNQKHDSFIDVEAVVKEVQLVLAPLAAQKSIAINGECQIDYPLLRGNEQFLYQALFNLVENAIKYTPANGKVCIRVYRNEQTVILEVQDTGVGIPKEVQTRIFERFYRVDEARSSNTGGNGIGLSIVKNIVALFQGEISVQSEVKTGSLFSIRLPISKE